MRRVGFSSGAVAYGNFRGALAILSEAKFSCIELSALRVSELRPLIEALPQLDLSAYSYISFHAPSNFSQEEEIWVADLLYTALPGAWPIVVHPDTIFDYSLWDKFGSRLAVENMDRRKSIGRTVEELQAIFNLLPDASLCFDVGHARQCDPSMTEAYLILSRFAKRLVQVHVSEVNSASQHDRISHGAKLAFRQIAGMIPESVPLIVESRVLADRVREEAERAVDSLALTSSAC
jgi:hypothetical protein